LFETIENTQITEDSFGKEFADSFKLDNEFGKEFVNSFNSDSIFSRDMSDTIRSDFSRQDTPPLTDEEKERIKAETGWPDEIIDNIASIEEYEIYKEAGLTAVEINGKWCLVRDDIDWTKNDEYGKTNQERLEHGKPPLDKEGNSIELHHVGQKSDSPLAELTQEEHRGKGNDSILHDKNQVSEIDRNKFNEEKREYWQDRANHTVTGGKDE
jgi:hypothetical protein